MKFDPSCVDVEHFLECSVPSCERPIKVKGVALCGGHYARWKRTGDVRAATPLRRFNQECSVQGCRVRAYGRGLCQRHHGRWKRLGDAEAGRDGVFGYKRAPNGSGHITKDGYRLVSVAGRKVLEHRLVMERRLGRELMPEETVHHRNGDRLDNRLPNLELWSGSHPPTQRVEDLVVWAREILARYAF